MKPTPTLISGYIRSVVDGPATLGILLGAAVLAFSGCDSAETPRPGIEAPATTLTATQPPSVTPTATPAPARNPTPPPTPTNAPSPTTTVEPTTTPTPNPVLDPRRIPRIRGLLILLPPDAYIKHYINLVDCVAGEPCPEIPFYVIERGNSTISATARTGKVTGEDIAPGEEGAFDFLKAALGIPVEPETTLRTTTQAPVPTPIPASEEHEEIIAARTRHREQFADQYQTVAGPETKGSTIVIKQHFYPASTGHLHRKFGRLRDVPVHME